MIKTIDIRNNSNDELYQKLTARTQMEHGDVLTTVSGVIENIKKNGDTAVLEYTYLFDKVKLDSCQLKVTQKEITNAYEKVDKELIEIIKRARINIEKYHEKQKENSWISTEENGVVLGQLYKPLEIVGIYIPGGTASLISTVLMTAVPAKVAGVSKIIMSTPPSMDGSVHPAILVAANEAGVDEIYRVGGAQAIAALAFGTETIPRVDKILGPGNIYVSTAKRLVFGYCDIDAFAGPSEILVVADDTGNPKYIAADLLSQAEHDVLSSAVLVTTSTTLAEAVKVEIERQTEYLSRKEIIKKSITDYGAIILVNNLDDAIAVVNKIAPEHLELCVQEPFNLMGKVKNAGAIFLGNYASEPLGDYFAGPSHVLPTSGTARFFSPLNVGQFIKKTSVISYTRNALEGVKDDVVKFAQAEGLDGHANAIKVRFEGE